MAIKENQSKILQNDFKSLPAEIDLLFRKYGKYVAFLRRQPVHATKVLFGIKVPTHEAAMIQSAWIGYRDNYFKCSRGTSKTFTIASLYPVLRGTLFKNIAMLVASASRFRGGKSVLKDSERLVQGKLKSQQLPKKWVVKSINHSSALKKEPDMWSMEFKSYSHVFTIPTNNDEAIRGLRANVLIVDERNTFDGQAIQTIYLPFLVVGGDFENPALGSEGNQVFYVGTIDYTYRDWYKDISIVKDLIKIQYSIQKTMMSGDWESYDRLLLEHGHKIHGMSLLFLRYDYTDLLIPTIIGKYKVVYPGAEKGKQIKWDQRDKRDYIYTYPVNKRQLEDPLDHGLADPESWLAEQRNIFIQASGTLYPPKMVEKATGPIFSPNEEVKRGWNSETEGTSYVPPVLYECSDPCVLGVDTARTSDLTAFIIIRVGSAPKDWFTNKKDYSVIDHSGYSQWSNVIWAESHQHMTIADTVDKIHDLRRRYNIVADHDIRGIAMDARGGGVQVRDELGNPKPPIDETGHPQAGWRQPQKVYDPEDEEYNVLVTDPTAWAGLRLLWTTDIMNQELVSFSRAQLDAGRLFIGAYKPWQVRKDPEGILAPGYLGVQSLKNQLLRIQQAATPSGKSVRYIMPGDTKLLENKKDIFMAFLYACFVLRQLVLKEIQQTDVAQPTNYGIVVRLRSTTSMLR